VAALGPRKGGGGHPLEKGGSQIPVLLIRKRKKGTHPTGRVGGGGGRVGGPLNRSTLGGGGGGGGRKKKGSEKALFFFFSAQKGEKGGGGPPLLACPNPEVAPPNRPF